MVEHHLDRACADAQRSIADRRRHRLYRIPPGDDDHRHRHQRQRQSADDRCRARHAEGAEKHRQPEQTEDDRRDCREVVDRYLDQIGPAVPRGVFFEIERGKNADRKRDQQRHQHREQRSLERAPDPGAGRVVGIGGGQEGQVEPGRNRAACLQRRDDRLGGGIALALGGDVDRVGGRRAELQLVAVGRQRGRQAGVAGRRQGQQAGFLVGGQGQRGQGGGAGLGIQNVIHHLKRQADAVGKSIQSRQILGLRVAAAARPQGYRGHNQCAGLLDMHHFQFRQVLKLNQDHFPLTLVLRG